VLIPEVTDDGLAQAAGTPEQLRVLRALGYRSAMIVALVARGQTLGALTFATAESGRDYEAGDLALAEELARRAAVAVDNARLYHEAQEASRMKDEFLATVSHELRTPLQAMLGWVGVLRQGKVNPERRVQALDIIERAGRAQAKLIEDLLDVSRIVTGRLHLDVRSTDLASVIEDVVDALRPAADAKNVTLAATLDRAVGTVAGDPVRLQQVVSNLLSNAVKFTPSGGHAEIRLEHSASEIRIIVTDTGQGIRPDFLSHVFEPFRQAEAASRRREGGIGLGLAIVRRVVELHGGRVEARSEGEGRGTEMIVTLPFNPLAAPASRSG
jgi:signal transduction histidine kinase